MASNYGLRLFYKYRVQAIFAEHVFVILIGRLSQV